MQMKSFRGGNSCKTIIALIKPITDLYEFIGARTESSPILSASIRAIVPIVHNNPAKKTLIQKLIE